MAQVPEEQAPEEQAPLRADARRNRDRLLAAARDAFTTAGPDASLEGVARSAGVGIGTLYRHFPNRETLLEAVYRNELAAVCASAADLLDTAEPPVALRRWMDRYAGFVIAKRGMAEALRAAVTGDVFATTQTRERLRAAVGTLLAAGAADGTLRADVPAEDVLTSLVGVMLATADATDPGQAGRMLDLIVAGLRPGTAS